MAEKNHDEDSRLDELVALNFKVTERERRDFKVWCAARGLTQVEAFKKGFIYGLSSRFSSFQGFLEGFLEGLENIRLHGDL